jgi:hypothetical protein
MAWNSQGQNIHGRFKASCKVGLEGVVSKRRDRPYCAGRPADWIKVKNWKHPAMSRVADSFVRICGQPCKQAQPSRTSAAQCRGKAMRVLVATLTLLVSSAASAQECKTCSMADACIKTYLKAASEAQTATKQAIRDWKQNLDRKASAELSGRGTAALQDAMEAQVRQELDRLKECLTKIR